MGDRQNNERQFCPKQSIASGESWIYSMGQKYCVHAFGYNSAESVPIWMKSGAL